MVFEADDEIVIGADESALPGLTFVPVAERKTVKNRLQIDLTPDAQAAEVSEARWGPPAEGWGRIIGLGAVRADVGQRPQATWVVLADPEGNEFCVLRPKKTLLD
ncbi:CO dehydrogenase/acetyl-CoA synthase delta subunit [Streptomyces sp. V1I1]|nr:CO dehydrogenase/acetyl-CoA synthase delta subunit [Streptomyces sp. V1I1]